MVIGAPQGSVPGTSPRPVVCSAAKSAKQAEEIIASRDRKPKLPGCCAKYAARAPMSSRTATASALCACVRISAESASSSARVRATAMTDT